MEHNFMRVNFEINTPVSGKSIEDNITGKPITINDNPVGYIYNAKIEPNGLHCNCEGLIWGRCLGIEYLKHIDSNSVEIVSVELGGENNRKIN